LIAANIGANLLFGAIVLSAFGAIAFPLAMAARRRRKFGPAPTAADPPTPEG